MNNTFARASITGMLLILSSTCIAFAWTGPTATPPGNNVAAPLNVTATSQVKNGGLGVTDNFIVFGTTTLDASLGSSPSTLTYLNFSNLLSPLVGVGGYGIRDNNGVLEFKNSGGSWQSIQATVSSLVNTSNPTFTTSVTSPQYCIGASCITSWPNAGTIGGAGTAGYVPLFTGATTLGNSVITQGGGVVTINASTTINGQIVQTGPAANWSMVMNWPNTSAPGYGILVGSSATGYSQFENASGYYTLLDNTSWGVQTNGNVTANDVYDAVAGKWLSSIAVPTAALTSCNVTVNAGQGGSCTTPACPAGYVRTGCSMSGTASYTSAGPTAAPANTQCTCSATSVAGNQTWVCYDYCVN